MAISRLQPIAILPKLLQHRYRTHRGVQVPNKRITPAPNERHLHALTAASSNLANADLNGLLH